MGAIKKIILFFSAYPFLVAFAGAFLGGEETTMTLSFLAGENILPLWIIAIGCLAGTIASDSFWFYFSRAPLADKLLARKHFSIGYTKVKSIFDKITNYNTLSVMLIGKFLYGTRIITIAYLSREKMNFTKFSLYNTIIIILWLLVIIPIGWLGGMGFGRAMTIEQGFQKLIFYLIIIIVSLQIFKYLIKKWLVKKYD